MPIDKELLRKGWGEKNGKFEGGAFYDMSILGGEEGVDSKLHFFCSLGYPLWDNLLPLLFILLLPMHLEPVPMATTSMEYSDKPLPLPLSSK